MRTRNSLRIDLSIQEKEEFQKQKNILDNLDLDAQVRDFENLELPKCPLCSSKNTAIVQVGLVSRSITLSSMTKKIHLRANGKPGKYFCNKCKEYFGE